MLHLGYFFILIKTRIKKQDISNAEQLWLKFRRKCLNLFGREKLDFPNYHWGNHMFEDCQKLGSLRFFWALLFELKHKEFKRSFDRGNKKNMEEHAAEKEKIVRELKLNYPTIVRKYDLLKKKQISPGKLRVGDYIILSLNQIKTVGKIQKIEKNRIDIFESSLGNTDQKLHLSKLIPIGNRQIEKDNALARCTILKMSEGSLYLNHFSFMFNKCKFQ
jgi:hypothetical protein